MILQVGLYTAMWKPEGRRFELIATFSDNIRGIKWMAPNKKTFPNTDYGFNMRVFKISTNIVSVYRISHYNSICLNNKETCPTICGPHEGGQTIEGRGEIFGNVEC